MALTTTAPDFSTCMTACEACVAACSTCLVAMRNSGISGAGAMLDPIVCIQACELAQHAMSTGAAIAPAACRACARSCEALARNCMLLPAAEYRSCAQACYRAARECYKVAQSCGRIVPDERQAAVH